MLLILGSVHSVRCTSQPNDPSCLDACAALSACSLLPSAFGAGKDPVANCHLRCSRDVVADVPAETGGDASADATGGASTDGTGGSSSAANASDGSIRERLLRCTDLLKAPRTRALGGAGGQEPGLGGAANGGQPTLEAGPWCTANCPNGGCATVASCISTAFTNPAARGLASAVLLAVDEHLEPQAGEYTDHGCWVGPESTPTLSQLCIELGNPTVRLAGDLEGVTRDGKERACSDVLGKRINLGEIVTGAYAPALDFMLPGQGCRRVVGTLQLAKAGEERVFLLPITTNGIAGARILEGTTACEGTPSESACTTASSGDGD